MYKQESKKQLKPQETSEPKDGQNKLSPIKKRMKTLRASPLQIDKKATIIPKTSMPGGKLALNLHFTQTLNPSHKSGPPASA